MSKLGTVLRAMDERREVWMGVVAIVVTVLFILFPRIPASLFLAVDAVLIALLGAEANREAKRRKASHSSSFEFRAVKEHEEPMAIPARSRLAWRKG